MNLEGRKIVCDVLAADPETQGATVTPEPGPGADARDVKIAGLGLGREAVLRVLGDNGLMPTSTEPHPSPDAPSLSFNSSVAIGESREMKIHGFRDRNSSDSNQLSLDLRDL